MLDEREFELINIVGGPVSPNQRDISRQMDLSLGMTNMLLRRLVTKGFLRIRQLDKRKVEYLLTPKGFSEKMKKSIRYTMRTINSLGLIKQGVKDVLTELVAKGHRSFCLFGPQDMVDLVLMTGREMCVEGVQFSKIDNLSDLSEKDFLLVCTEKLAVPAGVSSLNLLEELAKKENCVQQDHA